MAEAVTDEDVKKQRAVVEQLRQELAEKRAWMTDDARAGENAVKKARLDAEAEMLRNEIASLDRQAAVAAQAERSEQVKGKDGKVEGQSKEAKRGLLGERSQDPAPVEGESTKTPQEG